MEIAANKLLQETEIRCAEELAEESCSKVSQEIAEQESNKIAKAILYEALGSSAKKVAEALVFNATQEALEIANSYLRKASDHPIIIQATIEASEAKARAAAIDSIRDWSQERALVKAQEAAQNLLKKIILSNSKEQTLATLLLELNDYVAAHASESEFKDAKRKIAVENLLKNKAETAAQLACTQAFNPEARRAAQRAAQDAAGEIAAQAGEDIAREQSLDKAKQTAHETVHEQIKGLIISESQKQTLRIIREHLDNDLEQSNIAVREQYCQNNIERVAKESTEKALNEIANRQNFSIDEQALTKVVSNAAKFTMNSVSHCNTQDHAETRSIPLGLFIWLQLLVCILLACFFIFGGTDKLADFCRPALKAIFPSEAYNQIDSNSENEDELVPVQEDIPQNNSGN